MKEILGFDAINAFAVIMQLMFYCVKFSAVLMALKTYVFNQDCSSDFVATGTIEH